MKKIIATLSNLVSNALDKQPHLEGSDTYFKTLAHPDQSSDTANKGPLQEAGDLMKVLDSSTATSLANEHTLGGLANLCNSFANLVPLREAGAHDYFMNLSTHGVYIYFKGLGYSSALSPKAKECATYGLARLTHHRDNLVPLLEAGAHDYFMDVLDSNSPTVSTFAKDQALFGLVNLTYSAGNLVPLLYADAHNYLMNSLHSTALSSLAKEYAVKGLANLNRSDEMGDLRFKVKLLDCLKKFIRAGHAHGFARQDASTLFKSIENKMFWGHIFKFIFLS